MPGRAALDMKAKASRKSNSWILKLGVQRYLGISQVQLLDRYGVTRKADLVGGAGPLVASATTAEAVLAGV